MVFHWLELLSLTGSLLVETVAVFAIVEPQVTEEVTVKCTVNVFVCPTLSEKLLQSTLVWELFNTHSGEEPVGWKVSPAGITSATTTFCAVAEPTLVTVRL